jgi:protein-S-isoprenylcysteine O-methyltransferase Ste14
MGYPKWLDYSAYAGIALLAVQAALWVCLGSGGITWLAVAGIMLLMLGIVFIVLPLIQLRRRGGVADGENYGMTTTLVDSGLYAIIRHPQYLALPMLSVALALIVQHWAAALAGVLATALFCLTFRTADAMDIDGNIEKFGDDYRQYMHRVPGWNPIVGTWRVLRRER